MGLRPILAMFTFLFKRLQPNYSKNSYTWTELALKERKVYTLQELKLQGIKTRDGVVFS